MTLSQSPTFPGQTPTPEKERLKPLDNPRLQALFSDAIEGALAFGFQGNNRPPEGHWLWRFWNIGNAERESMPLVPMLLLASMGVRAIAEDYELDELTRDEWRSFAEVIYPFMPNEGDDQQIIAEISKALSFLRSAALIHGEQK